MTHAHHEALPGYSPNAILHEGCAECESRANLNGLLHLDWRNARRAVERAVEWQHEGLRDTNVAEIGLLQAVWTMLVFLETNTDLTPIRGELPWTDFEAIEARIFGRHSS